MSDDSNVIKGPFRPPKPSVSAGFEINIRQEVEKRPDGPWLVVYLNGRKIGEAPIKPGTEPRIKRAKVLPFMSDSPRSGD